MKKKKRRKGNINTIAMETYDFLEQNYADKDLSIRDMRRALRKVIDRLDFYEIVQEISEADTIIIHPFEKGYKERIFGNSKREVEEEKPEGKESELFVEEDIRDAIAGCPELQKLSKEGKKWKVKTPADWKGIVHPCDFPDSGTAKVMVGKTVIGVVSWKTRFEIIQGALGKYIEAYPDKVKFKRKKIE